MKIMYTFQIKKIWKMKIKQKEGIENAEYEGVHLVLNVL